jgi:hypothetical protein
MDGKGESSLYSRLCLAHYPPVPQEGIPAKFARDRRRYLQWLFEAKKRFGNYIAPESFEE